MAVRKLSEIKTDTLFRTVAANVQKIGEKYFASIPVELLTWDESYQRTDTRDKRKIEALAKNWNHHKMSPLLVTAHKEKNMFCIVDGYGRYTANAMRPDGFTELECEIIFDVPENEEDRRKFEAELFVRQKDEEEYLKPVQKHKANLTLGDPAAVAVENACKQYNVEWVNTKGWRDIKILGSYSDAYAIAKHAGEEGLKCVFDIIHQLSWDEEPNGYSKLVMTSLRQVYRASQKDETAKSKVVAALRGMKPKNLEAFAHSKYPLRGSLAASRMYIEDILNQ